MLNSISCLARASHRHCRPGVTGPPFGNPTVKRVSTARTISPYLTEKVSSPVTPTCRCLELFRWACSRMLSCISFTCTRRTRLEAALVSRCHRRLGEQRPSYFAPTELPQVNWCGLCWCPYPYVSHVVDPGPCQSHYGGPKGGSGGPGDQLADRESSVGCLFALDGSTSGRAERKAEEEETMQGGE